MPKEYLKSGTYETHQDVVETIVGEGSENLPAHTRIEPYNLGDPIDSDATIYQHPSLTLRWYKDSHVQACVSVDVEHIQRLAASYPPGQFGDRAEIPVEVLSRSEINNMIKLLRKARDQAYGADE